MIERLLQLYPNSSDFVIMKAMNTIVPHTFTLFLIALITGCGSSKHLSHSKEYYYHNIYFGRGLSTDFKKGIQDGCETSRGVYTKSHKAFNNSNDYHNGWFTGRNKCRGLLKIDEDGNLIL